MGIRPRSRFALVLVGLLAPVAPIFWGPTLPPAAAQATQDAVKYREDKDVQKVWLADGFAFTGYDTLYIADTQSVVSDLNADEVQLIAWAKDFLRDELAAAIQGKQVLGAVVTKESDIKPDGKTLRLENTARYWAGLYGAGQPVIKVRGRMTDGEAPLFLFEIRRSGVGAGAKWLGGYKSDRDIQANDIRDLAKGMAEFIARTAKR